MILTVISAGSQGIGLTRMNLPYMLGTMVTRNRDRAKFYGFGMHVLMGWAFSLVYVITFESLGYATWWLGGAIGLVHAAFVLVVLVSFLPGLHPRMASEQHGPTAENMLEPPGFLALNFGTRTPIAILIAHLVFGMILGGFYQLR